jgi:hypothetical protein
MSLRLVRYLEGLGGLRRPITEGGRDVEYLMIGNRRCTFKPTE